MVMLKILKDLISQFDNFSRQLVMHTTKEIEGLMYFGINLYS